MGMWQALRDAAERLRDGYQGTSTYTTTTETVTSSAAASDTPAEWTCSEWTCSGSGYTWAATTLPPAPKMSSYVLAEMSRLQRAGQQPTHLRVSVSCWDALLREFPVGIFDTSNWMLFGLHGEVDPNIADFVIECRGAQPAGKPVQEATFSRRRGMDL